MPNYIRTLQDVRKAREQVRSQTLGPDEDIADTLELIRERLAVLPAEIAAALGIRRAAYGGNSARDTRIPPRKIFRTHGQVSPGCVIPHELNVTSRRINASAFDLP